MNNTLTSADILPAPFAWIDIPAGNVTLEYGDWVRNKPTKQFKYKVKSKKDFTVAAYAISKYPITNAQYTKFIESNGYTNHVWWTEQGWEIREKKGWTEPRIWREEKWNESEHPVVGVSWFEAVAFCRWLSSESGENIMLPTEQQWQRAAQGDDGRAFPWGNTWDSDKCNNFVDNEGIGIGQTTPVTQYPAGVSPYGVMDMSGNAWEWCLTSYEEDNDVNGNVTYRVLRGGAWSNYFVDSFRATSRHRFDPDFGNGYLGFRCARS